MAVIYKASTKEGSYKNITLRTYIVIGEDGTDAWNKVLDVMTERELVTGFERIDPDETPALLLTETKVEVNTI